MESCDHTANEMLTKISEFAKSDGHGSLVALAVMGHGNTRGDICGLQQTTCGVQQVIDSLCQPHLESATKVVQNGKRSRLSEFV